MATNYDAFFTAVNHIKADADLLRQLVRDSEPGTVTVGGEPRDNVAKQLADTIARIETDIEAILPDLRAIQQTVATDSAAAADEADRSTQASSAAIAAVNVQPDLATGLANTASGELFSVPSPESDLLLTLYRNNGGSDEDLGSYPSAIAIQQVALTLSYALDLAGQSARQVLDDRAINQILSAIAAAHDTAGQAARSVPIGYLRALIQQLHIDAQGRVGIGTNTPGAALDIAGGRLRLRESQPPASSSAPGLPGEIAWGNNYKYLCVAANSWRRIPLETW